MGDAWGSLLVGAEFEDAFLCITVDLLEGPSTLQYVLGRIGLSALLNCDRDHLSREKSKNVII